MRIDAPAKINWALNVLSKSPDGYHTLDMLNQRISIQDSITLLPHPDILLSVTGMEDPPKAEDNLAIRAAQVLKEYSGYQGGAHISLEKRIPVQAGLGGGSADAAAVLLGLNQLWELGLSLAVLEKIGVMLGADVPGCLYQGLTRVGGIGEQVVPLPAAATCHLLILKPSGGLSTRKVFSRFDQAPDRDPGDVTLAARALMQGDYSALGHFCRNQLQQAAAAMMPEIQDAIGALKDHGALFARLSGSGSAVFGLFPNEKTAKESQEILKAAWPVCLYARTYG